MLLGIVIGLAGLALVGVAYINRDPLSDTPAIRRLAPYVIGVVLSIAVGVVVVMLTTEPDRHLRRPDELRLQRPLIAIVDTGLLRRTSHRRRVFGSHHEAPLRGRCL